ncbi:MAG: dephospho-CoA kinase [Gammaproteobacteria bacterium]|nr:dephospho-CoA kinase [Gammaproteobacteria bacterium]
MYCVGLVGSIASGKSTVASLFAQQGVNLISADHIARQLTTPDQPAYTNIVQHFGHSFVDATEQLNRTLLREYIFQHPEERVWLEQLLHPLIRQEINKQIQIKPNAYYMIEIPLLTSKKEYPYLNRVLLIMAEAQIRIQRVMARDTCSEKQANAILEAQASEETYRAVADDVLVNHDSLKDLEAQVLALHQIYLTESLRPTDKP